MPAKDKDKLLPEEAIGLAVRDIRRHKSLSQEQLGFAANLHRTFVSDVERGARNPTVRTLWKLAEALGVKPQFIVEMAERHYGFPDK